MRAAEVARVRRTIACVEAAGDALVLLGTARVERVTVSLATVVRAAVTQEVEARAVGQCGGSEEPPVGPCRVRREHVPALIERHRSKQRPEVAAGPERLHL